LRSRKKNKMNNKTITVLAGLSLVLLSFGLGVSNVQAGLYAPVQQVAPPITTPVETPRVPGFITSTPNPDGSVHHIVREGEYPLTIADGYGITLQELLLLNNLDANPILQVGQDLLIRKPGSIEMPTATLNPTEEAMLVVASSVPPTLDIQALVAGTATAQIVTQFAGKIGPGTPYPTSTSTPGPGIFSRIFSSQARYLGLGVIGIVIFGLLLLIISARKMQQ
jgi:LysM repeat protein